ncbi:MAG: copper amine oxidase N-terminal domain-containing protein [Candidatus Eremiobacteraeota bacterium]|nr:copper amine oxidase N-terminal domain-containing protein [Candidatus Eremiobacteraeota bacterium]
MNWERPGWSTLAVTAALALVVSLTLAFSRSVELRVNGQNIATDVAPVTHQSDVFVPLRAISEALGADAHFDGKSKQVEITRGDQTVRLRVGDTKGTLNGYPLTLSHAPFRVRGRVMVSLNGIARAFGTKVSYDRRTSRIDVITSGIKEAGAQQDSP